MGKPVIVSNVGDMGSLLRETPAGLVVLPDDPDALCAAMQQMALRGMEAFAAAVRALAASLDIQCVAARWLERSVRPFLTVMLPLLAMDDRVDPSNCMIDERVSYDVTQNSGFGRAWEDATTVVSYITVGVDSCQFSRLDRLVRDWPPR
ncbi:MAG: hypothetical protein QF541_10095 [Lentisphaeria bacterium]|jgi:hypothetical protein|nr:hypothetical protein [Lentisphaeria bacterium]